MNAGTPAADRLSSSLTLPVFPCRCGPSCVACVRAQDNLVTTGFDLAGCDKGHYNMMSLSYVNKGFFGKWRAGRTD